MADEPHPQAQAVLDAVESSPMPPTYALSVESARGVLEEFFANEDPRHLGDVTEFEIEGPAEPIPVRVYEPATPGSHPALVFLHGGGWVIGSLDTHDNICRWLCEEADCAVVSVDYRLAPEHPFPAAVEDSYAATAWVADYGEKLDVDTDRIAVGGDSAGGNLTAAVTLLADDERGVDDHRRTAETVPEIDYQVLLYPAVASPTLHTFDSQTENAEGYFLEWESVRWFYERYLPEPTHRRNEYAAPLLAESLSGLPPASVVTAGFDPLCDEGLAYADRLDDAGVPVERHHYEGMIHGFASLPEMMDDAGDALDAVAADLRAAFE
jgi:acetyl esterase